MAKKKNLMNFQYYILKIDKTKALSNEAILNIYNKKCNRIIKLS